MTHVIVCASCGADQTTDHAVICTTCTRRLAARLAGVPELLTHLRVNITRQARLDRPTTSRRTQTPDDLGDVLTAAAAPAPLDLTALAALDDLVAVVRYWADRLAAETHSLSPTEDGASATRWLEARAPALRHRPYAPDASRAILAAIRHAWSLVDQPPERWYAGRCDEQVDVGDAVDCPCTCHTGPYAVCDQPGGCHTAHQAECGTELYAAAGDGTVTCRGCGARWDVAARRDWLLESAADVQVTAVQAATALTSMRLPVTPERVRQWKSRGHLVSSGCDVHGRPLYRLGDITALLQRETYGIPAPRAEAS